MDSVILEELRNKGIMVIICLFCIVSLSYANDTVSIQIINDDDQKRCFTAIGAFNFGLVAQANPAIAYNWQWWADEGLYGSPGFQDSQWSCVNTVGSWNAGMYNVGVSADPGASSDTTTVYVSEVEEIVNHHLEGGMQFVSLNDPISLFANSNPNNGQAPPNNMYYFPAGTPTWTITDKTQGINPPQLNPYNTYQCAGGGTDGVTVSNLTVPGVYVLHAECSEYDDGDDIPIMVVGDDPYVNIGYGDLYWYVYIEDNDEWNSEIFEPVFVYPPGGDYSWEIIDGEEYVSLTDDDGEVASIQLLGPSTDPYDVEIELTYTVNGHSSSDSAFINVRTPVSMTFLGGSEWETVMLQTELDIS